MTAFALRIYSHTPITDGTIVSVTDFADLILNFLFMGIVIRLPMFPVVIVCVWANEEILLILHVSEDSLS